MPDPSFSETHSRLTAQPHSVLIPTANPERAFQYLQLGARIARCYGSELLLLYVERDDEVKASEVITGIEGETQEVLEDVYEQAVPFDVPTRWMKLRAKDVAEGIVFVAQAPHIEYLIMGWRGDEKGGKTVIGQNIDGMIREADSHAVIMQEGDLREGERILVPTANPELAPLALAIASLVRGGKGPPITILYISPVELKGEDKERVRSDLLSCTEKTEGELAPLIGERSQFEVDFAAWEEPMKGLVEQSAHYDRIIIEASQDETMRKVMYGGRPAELARETRCPLLFVRPRGRGGKFGM